MENLRVLKSTKVKVDTPPPQRNTVYGVGVRRMKKDSQSFIEQGKGSRQEPVRQTTFVLLGESLAEKCWQG